MENKISKLYLIIILLYQSQGLFYDSGSILSRLLMFIWLFLSLIYAFRLFMTSKTNSIDILIGLFVIMHTLYWTFSPKILLGDYGESKTYMVFKDILTVQLSYFPFRYFTYKKYITKREIQWFSLILLFILIPQFFRHQAELMLIADSENVTNNDSYFFVALIPLFTVFFSNKKIMFPAFIVCVTFVLLGAKRGAILCMIFVCLAFFYYLLKLMKRKSTFLGILLVFLFIGVIITVCSSIFENNEYLQMRLYETQENNTSGRDVIYSTLFTYCMGRTNFVEAIFGEGFMYTINIAGITAHQDWLELWTNNGFLGLIIYFSIFIAIFRYFIKYKKFMPFESRAMYIGASSVWLLKSVYSMGYYDPCVSLCMLAISYSISVTKANMVPKINC